MKEGVIITTEKQKNSILSDKFFKFIFFKEYISNINIKDIDITKSKLALELSTKKEKE